MTAGQDQKDYIQRCKQFQEISKSLQFPQGGLSIDDHDHVFWMGDLNARLQWTQRGGMPIGSVAEKIRNRQVHGLLDSDQLTMSRRQAMAFQGFQEPPITFLPSFKWHADKDELNMTAQKDVPAWCDRILYRPKEQPGDGTPKPNARFIKYDCYPGLQQSDHRPVFAIWGIPYKFGITLGP